MDFLFESHAEEKEKTEVLDDVENAVSRGVQFMQNVRKCMDLFGDKNGPSSYHILDDLQLHSKCFFILLLMLVLIHHLTTPYMKYQEGYWDREVMRWFWNNHVSNQTAFSMRRWQEKLLDPLLNQGPKHHKITKFKLNYSI